MKRIKVFVSLLLLVSMLIPLLPAAAEEIDIASTFPDTNFRSYITENFDDIGDGKLSEFEIQRVTSIDCSDKNIASLQGIEVFSALQRLDCYDNQLTSLDLSHNTSLVHLDCSLNQISKLNVNGCTELYTLTCDNNSLTALDVRSNKKLRFFDCSRNTLSSLDVSANVDLEVLYLEESHLKDLDLSKNPCLGTLCCYGNDFDKLNIAHQPKLLDLVTSQEPVTVSGKFNYKLWSSGYDLLAIDLGTELVLEAMDLLPPTYTDDTGVYAIENGEATFQRPSRTNVSNVKVPDAITIGTLSVPVTKIGQNAFRNHQKKLTKVTIGANVREIGKNAFLKCAKLKTVSGGANLEIIGGSAFQSCTKLTKFTIGAKVKEIGKKAFNKCSSLKKITIKSKLLTTQTVGNSAFKGINASATIKVPKAVKKEYTKWLLKKGVKKTMKIK